MASPGSWGLAGAFFQVAGKPTARGIGFEPALEAAGLGLEGSPEVSDEFTNGAAGLFEVALDVLTSALLPSAPDLLYGGHAR